MSNKEFITINAFCYEYDINKSSIEVRKSKHSLPPHIFRKESFDDRMMIDKNFFVRRKNHEEKITNICHDMYYELYEDFNEHQMSKIMFLFDEKRRGLQNYITFIKSNLFMRLNESIIKYKIKGMIWSFYKIMKLFLYHYRCMNFSERQRLNKILLKITINTEP